MKKPDIKTVVITGVTSGLGLSLAQLLVMKKYRVIGIGRQPFELVDQSIRERINYLQIDLSEEYAVDTLPTVLKESNVTGIDMLFLNAATGYYGEFESQDAKNINNIIMANLWSPIRITQLLLPWLRQKNGSVIFISSIMSQFKTPKYALYTATKAALDRFAKDLAIEEEGNIQVYLKQPGAMLTALHQKIGYPVKKNSSFKSPLQVAESLINQIQKKKECKHLFFAEALFKIMFSVIEFMCSAYRCIKSFSSKKQKYETIVITGAAQGIGKALALAYAASSKRIVLIDRNHQKLIRLRRHLESTSSAEIVDIILDITERQSPLRILTELQNCKNITFFHNAGVNFAKPFILNTRDEMKQMLEVNLISPVQLTHLLIKHLPASCNIRFVYTSSLSRFVSYPGASFYAATKDAIYSFAKGISNVADTAVICPGPTETAQARANSPLPNKQRKTASLVVRQIQNQLSHGFTIILPGIEIIAIVFAASIFEGLFRRIMKYVLWMPIKQKFTIPGNLLPNEKKDLNAA